MIARPKISQNEWKTAEIGAFEVWNFALLSCPGSRPTWPRSARPGGTWRRGSPAPTSEMRSKMRRRDDDSRATLERRASRRSVGRLPNDVARREGAARPRAAVSSISRWGTSCQTADEPSPPLFSKRTATDACVDFKSSIKCENMRRFRRELFCRASRTQHKQSIRPKISRIDFDVTELESRFPRRRTRASRRAPASQWPCAPRRRSRRRSSS